MAALGRGGLRKGVTSAGERAKNSRGREGGRWQGERLLCFLPPAESLLLSHQFCSACEKFQSSNIQSVSPGEAA